MSPEHNQADIAFVQGMIPHHSQAVDMAEIASDQAASPRFKELAREIEQAQDPEIERLKAMLRAWGAPEPDSGGMGSVGRIAGMPGMMSDEQMGQLRQAQGAAFDRMFLRTMTEHHRGAIEMSQTELAQGQNPQAKELARKIIDEQRAEIGTMEELLKTV